MFACCELICKFSFQFWLKSRSRYLYQATLLSSKQMALQINGNS